MPQLLKNKFFILASLLLLFIMGYYSSGYFFIYNNDAYVSADVIKITPSVSGPINEVNVKDNQSVKRGDLLISLDQEPFNIAVDNALALVSQAIAQQSLLSTQLKEAKASIEISQAQVNFAKLEYERYKILQKKNSVSENDLDAKKEQYNIATATLEKSQLTYQDLQKRAPLDQALVLQQKAALRQANYNLKMSKLYAPSDGYINNLKVYSGDYANQATPLFGFISQDSEHIIANIKESNLVSLTKGTSVWVYLSNHPWKLYRGKVDSLGRGVSRNSTQPDPSLPYVEPITNWIRYEYRIPVRIKLINFPKDKALPVGIDAKVIVF
ncbi:HlyD family secretion protein [Shewanella surugensis]|uniref:HlyD family secretion protein n=1 Tax=Shewanella surugensis TaxID=212020 RepID=A0ABT0LDW6_9GAMM|nr:HlyD family secretion protein [Shewanella surugensis]MCL1125887.1 HlyD family secretion protein [Shewanella surugensis]